MSMAASGREPLVTVDVRTLETVRWGPLRQLFPSFVEEIELGRYLKRLLADNECRPVQIERHCDANGAVSSHIFDVYLLG